ncbi:MAG: DUF2214 domain-containing protein [Aestuariivirgaceae bacterium]
MDAILSALEQSQIALFFRGARWSYALLNATHILGIALLVGAILPLDLRLLGLWPDIDRRHLARVLIPMAAVGLCIAAAAGLILFSTRAGEYAALTVFRIKLVMIAAGVGSALLMHARYGLWLEKATRTQLVVAGSISMMCWLGALVCGRLIAFVV